MTWLARRIAVSFGLAWVVVTVVFLSLHAIPGDPAELLLTSDNGILPDPDAVADLRRSLGLDRPLHEQYLSFLSGLLRLDLGQSLLDGYSVAEEIMLRLPRTLELIFASAAIAAVAGMSGGMLAAVRKGGRFDRASGLVVSIVQATPVFVLGTLMVLVFAQKLGWMPAGGFVPFSQDPWQHLLLLLMPALATSARLTVDVFRMTRASALEVLSRDYVRTARAKGVPPRRILTRHVGRASLIPIITLLGMDMGALLGGTVLVEHIFNWPGISAPLMHSIAARDYPMVAGIVLTISLLFLLINLLTDLAYHAIDPRVRAA